MLRSLANKIEAHLFPKFDLAHLFFFFSHHHHHFFYVQIYILLNRTLNSPWDVFRTLMSSFEFGELLNHLYIVCVSNGWPPCISCSPSMCCQFTHIHMHFE
ncbi:hypothetical protein ACH5RR_006638 [Cinchona calisaya]|uniref:Uncharacterized protein n=1 Tax=Cinchona calisaya TaxID=153742 RepID=A0ABD3APK3_9GENT